MREKEKEGIIPFDLDGGFWAAESLTREKQAAFKRMKERQALNHARGGIGRRERREPQSEKKYIDS